MKKISSLQNPIIKQVTSLHLTKGRKALQLFIAEGFRTVQTILQHQKRPKHLFCTEKMLVEAEELSFPASEFWIVTDEVMAKLSAATTPAGILGVFDIPKPSTNLTTGLVLAQIADPGNMGTLIRTCAAMGDKTVITIEGCDPWSPKVVQASAGTIMQLNVFEMSWKELIAQKKELPLCALVVSGGQKPTALNLQKSLLVVGNEAHGLPNDWIKDCDQKLTLPMPGNTESLNAAVAGSIAIYLSRTKI